MVHISSPKAAVLGIVATVLVQRGPDLSQNVGKDVRVCGTIGTSQTDARGRLRLDLTAANQQVTVRVDRPQAFGPNFVARATAGPVCVSGRLERSGQQLQIQLDDVESIQSDDVPVPRPAGFAAGTPDLLSETDIAPPRPIGSLTALYTPDAQRAKRQGAAEFEGIVRTDGSVGLVRVSRSMDRLWGLDESALAAVRALRFEPATRASRPVDVLTRFLVEFSLLNGNVSGTITVFLGYPLTREPAGLAKVSDVTGLKVLSQVNPQYTSSAMRRKIQGQVELEAFVDTDGSAHVLRITKSLDPFGLDLSAIRAAESWRFEPGRVNGTPVATRVQMMLEFRLH